MAVGTELDGKFHLGDFSYNLIQEDEILSTT